MAKTIAFEHVPQTSSNLIDFADTTISITSPPPGIEYIDISGSLRDAESFHGSTDVHDVIEFGPSFSKLIGDFSEPGSIFEDRDGLPDEGVIILADHFPEAAEVVRNIDGMAKLLVQDVRRYDDLEFCTDYLELARAGYGLLRQHLPDFELGQEQGVPISLVRAGLVTTRLAQGLDHNSVVDNEVRVVTKRAHPKNGSDSDLMVTVKWEDIDGDLKALDSTTLDMADFVNPASWASAAALLLSARQRGANPTGLVHRSIMATEQGIEFSRDILRLGTLGEIQPFYYSVGSSRTLTGEYYLANPAVGDAGHVLRHFLPDWYWRERS